jgi:hypothetical protein
MKPNRKKTEPNKKNRAKTEKPEPNWFEPVFVLKNRTEIGRFELVSVFLFKKFWFGYFFLNKNRIKLKIITPIKYR